MNAEHTDYGWLFREPAGFDPIYLGSLCIKCMSTLFNVLVNI